MQIDCRPSRISDNLRRNILLNNKPLISNDADGIIHLYSNGFHTINCDAFNEARLTSYLMNLHVTLIDFEWQNANTIIIVGLYLGSDVISIGLNRNQPIVSFERISTKTRIKVQPGMHIPIIRIQVTCPPSDPILSLTPRYFFTIQADLEPGNRR